MEPLFDSLFNRAPINAKSPFFIRAFFASSHRSLALLDSRSLSRDLRYKFSIEFNRRGAREAAGIYKK